MGQVIKISYLQENKFKEPPDNKVHPGKDLFNCSTAVYALCRDLPGIVGEILLGPRGIQDLVETEVVMDSTSSRLRKPSITFEL
jgi:hypothetical protein